MSTTGLVVDRLTPADVDACAHLEALLFPGDDPWSAAAFREELRAGHTYLAARRAGTDGDAVLVGYAGIALLPAPPMSRSESRADGPAPLRFVSEAEVHTIGVHPSEQGRGTGRRLLRGLLDAADAISAVVYLEVRTDNVAALALYRSEGFVVVGTRRRYYASGADAHTMRRPAAGAEGAATPPGDPR
jgi:ribosomal-protein-alanine N-acetyltransferase